MKGLRDSVGLALGEASWPAPQTGAGQGRLARRIEECGRPFWLVHSRRDEDNWLAGLAPGLREAVLECLDAAMWARLEQSKDGAVLRDEFLSWLSAHLLGTIVARGSIKWGTRTRVQKQSVASWSHKRRPLLDRFPPALLPAHLRSRDLPRQLVEHRKRLLKQLMTQCVFLPTAQVAEELTRMLIKWAGAKPQEDLVGKLVRQFLARRAMSFEGATITAQGLASIVSYFGLGEELRRKRQRGYGLVPYRVAFTLELLRGPYGLNLDELHWAKGLHVTYQEWHGHMQARRDAEKRPDWNAAVEEGWDDLPDDDATAHGSDTAW